MVTVGDVAGVDVDASVAPVVGVVIVEVVGSTDEEESVP